MAKSFEDIPGERAWVAQQAALMRLQVYATGAVHDIFLRCGRSIRGEILRFAQNDSGGGPAGALDGLGMARVTQVIDRAWKDARDEWYDVLTALRREAVEIAFGSLAVAHNFQFAGRKAQVASRKSQVASRRAASRVAGSGMAEEIGATFVFDPQLRRVMAAADMRVYGDGLRLSQRIWRLDQESLAGIKRELYAGVARGDSAWNIAERVEQFLGAGQDCPRWTTTRLYKLTKKDIASGDRTGLYSGDECAGQGVAYNALRMARTEIQAIHHMATDEVLRNLPWAQGEQVRLSPAHPEQDICDDVVEGGENGDGVYPVGTIILPLHPHCLCHKAAVQMDQDEFVRRLRGWVDGTAEWPEMDGYADWIGLGAAAADRSAVIGSGMGPERPEGWLGAWINVPAALTLVAWLWGDAGELDGRVRA